MKYHPKPLSSSCTSLAFLILNRVQYDGFKISFINQPNRCGFRTRHLRNDGVVTYGMTSWCSPLSSSKFLVEDLYEINTASSSKFLVEDLLSYFIDSVQDTYGMTSWGHLRNDGLVFSPVILEVSCRGSI